MTLTDAASPSRRRRFRLSVRALMLLVAVIGLTLGLGQFWLANLNIDRAILSYQMRMLTDGELPSVSRVGAIDGMIQARGRQARRAVKLLAATLDDPSEILRVEAAEMIAKLGLQILKKDAGPAGIATVRPGARALLDAIDDPSPRVAEAAIHALSVLDRDDTNPLVDPDALSETLHDLLRSDRGPGPDWIEARHAAINLLAARERDLGGTPDWFLTALDDPEPQTRLVAMTALVGKLGLDQPRQENIAAADAPGWLLRALSNGNKEVRQLAIWNCSGTSSFGGRFAPWADRARVARALREIIDHVDDDERPAVILNLAINDPQAGSEFVPEVIRRLEDALETGQWQGSDVHMQTLKHVGPAARPAVPVIHEFARRARGHAPAWVAEHVIRVLLALDPSDPEALALLNDLIVRWLDSVVHMMASLQHAEGELADIRNHPGIDHWIDMPLNKDMLDVIRYFGPASRARVEMLLWVELRGPLEREAVRRLALQIDPTLLSDNSGGSEKK